MTTESRLQSLRIPAGWSVKYNEWREIEPEHPDAWTWLNEDLLQLGHDNWNLIVDVGWYGGELGCFTAVVHKHDFQGPELARFTSRNRLEVTAVVENWLANPQTLSQHENTVS